MRFQYEKGLQSMWCLIDVYVVKCRRVVELIFLVLATAEYNLLLNIINMHIISSFP